MLRRLRKIFLLFAALILVGMSLLLVVANLYETEVKVKLIGALNKQLNAPVTVSDMDLTLVTRFPQASMVLHDVLVKEVRSDGMEPDTLLYAQELFLEFSLWQLFSGNYTVEQIHGANVRLYAGLDGNGKENFIVWKTDTTATDHSPIALDKVSFSGLDVRYRDDRSALVITSHHDALTLRGSFSDALNVVDLSGDAHLQKWVHGQNTVLEDRAMHLRLTMEFGGDDALFRIRKGEVISGKVPLEVTLAVTNDGKGNYLDLRANGLGLGLAETLSLLPQNLMRSLHRYRINGEVDLAVHYVGLIAGAGPSLSVGAKVTKGKLKEANSGATFTDVFGELALDLTPSGVPKKLVVKGFSAKSSSGSISGNWQSNGLTNALVKADLRANLALAELLRFAQVDTLEQVTGTMKADLHVNGKLRDMGNIKASDLSALHFSGTADLRNATLKMKGVRHRVEHLDADLSLHGNDATVQGLKTEYQGNAIKLSGTLRNLMPYLLYKDQHLVIEAKGSSPRIDLAALLRSDDGEQANSKDYTLTLPRTVEMDLTTTVDELVFEEFKATGIKGKITMHDRVLRATELTFSSASGTVSGGLELDARNSGHDYPLAIKATLKDIEIDQLFKEFQDFGQDFIGYRHLSGRTHADIAFNAPLSTAMKLNIDRLVCVIDIGVDNGSIKGHAPLLEVADHLQKNKLVAPFVDIPQLRKQLGDVKFAHLENQVEIRDGAVHIPSMLVSSSVMDIELSGTHWFDDRIDHHLNFRLSDLFRKNTTTDEFGPIVDDGTGMRIFLHMYGTANDPQFGNDGAMAAAKRKKQFQNEKQELKSILREELGLFKGRDEAKVGSQPTTTTPEGSKTTQFKVAFTEPDTTNTARVSAPKEKERKGFGKLREPEKKAPRFEVVQ